MANQTATTVGIASVTCLAFAPNGSRVFTGSDDQLIRIWDMENLGSEAESTGLMAEANKAITSLSISDKFLISTSEDAEVRRYSIAGNHLGLITNTACPAWCAAIDPRGKFVAVASDEPTVRLIDTDDVSNVRLLAGHERGVRNVTWHPKSTLLAASGWDGNLTLWDVSEDPPQKVATVDHLLPPFKDSVVTKGYNYGAVWHPTGEYFFVLSKAYGVVTVSKRLGWKKDREFSGSDGPTTAISVSPNGLYLASASKSQVQIWDIKQGKVITSHGNQCDDEDTSVPALAFSPTANTVAWTTTGGKLMRWTDAIPPSFPDPFTHVDATAALTAILPHKEDDLDDLLGDSGFEDLDVEEQEQPEDDVHGWIDEDEDLGLDKNDGMVREMVSITKAQPAFQPGAANLSPTKRLLAYNKIGWIEVTVIADQVYHMLDVKLHDKSRRADMSFRDDYKYHLGYLGERGALLACSESESSPAQVHYRPFHPSTQIQWTYSLRPQTRVLGIAAGGVPPTAGSDDMDETDLNGFGNVVVATSEGDLTFLSGTGRERRVLGLGGDFVAMVAGDEWVFVVHRAGSTTIDGSQNLSYSLFNFEDFSVRQRDFLPIPKGHQLTWVGVSEEGAPSMFDTTGRLHVLMKHRIPHHASWVRVMDTKIASTEFKGTYWPIAVYGTTFMCFLLGGSKTLGYPLPPFQDIPMQMPFRSQDPADERLEMDALMIELKRDALDEELTSEDITKREQAMDKQLVLLIQNACKLNQVPRAIELAKLIQNPRFLDMVIKVAEFYRFTAMIEKVRVLKTAREQSEDRLVLAREKRRQWTRPDPVPYYLAPKAESDPPRPKAFQDFGPPPTVSRPGLAPATVAVETTRYPSSSEPRMPPPAIPPPETKRKRDENEEESSASTDFIAPPPKQKTNPFARKSGQEDGRNPFARKGEAAKTIRKSESFFEKVDAAEDAPRTKRPPKDKKDGPKQATLFSMMGSSAKKSRLPVSSQVTESDITMSDVTTVDSQTELPEEWEETQPLETQVEPI